MQHQKLSNYLFFLVVYESGIDENVVLLFIVYYKAKAVKLVTNRCVCQWL